MSNIKAIIFDLDGVIIMSEYPTFLLLQQILQKYNFSLNRENYPQRVGKKIKHFLAEISEGRLTAEVQNKILEIFFREYNNHPEKYTKPMPVTINFIKKKHGDIKIGLASMSGKNEILQTLKRLKINSFFDCIVSSDDILHPKPYPEIYLKVLEILQLSSQHCIAIEDTPIGIQSAINAKIEPYVFLNGINKKEDFDTLPVKGFLTSENDIARLVT